MSHITPENLRFHAAGFLGAAAVLADVGDERGARAVLAVVEKYVDLPNVSAPPQLKEKLAYAMENPKSAIADIHLLEQWFVDPLNTTIEKTGGRF